MDYASALSFGLYADDTTESGALFISLGWLEEVSESGGGSFWRFWRVLHKI